jgi:hypothetical protein
MRTYINPFLVSDLDRPFATLDAWRVIQGAEMLCEVYFSPQRAAIKG